MANRALVTGAGIRLGRAMALYLAGRGFDVAVHYASSADAADAVVAEIKGMGQTAVALNADLLDEVATQALIGRAKDGLGGVLNCLVNNASIFEPDRLETITRESWDRHLDTNLRAPVVLTQGFAAQAPGAVIDQAGAPLSQALVVNMLDQTVQNLTPEFSSYTIAKMGLKAFTHTAAQSLAPDIRVNAIAPGTTVQGHRQSSQHFARQRAATPLGRGSDPKDICAALGYFLESQAVTGQVLYVDGGQRLGRKPANTTGLE